MKIDPNTTADAVQRTLEEVERDGKQAWKLTASRLYDTDIDDTWDALTNPERLPRWFLPVSGELEVGGRYQLEGNAGGEIERCEPPTLLAVTWGMHGEDSWVTVTLRAEEERTRFVLEHVAHVPESMWSEYGPGAMGVGWDLALAGLQLHLSTKAAIDPKAFEAWTQSEPGRALVSSCSDGWASASIAAGTDAAQARAGAAATTQFYAPAPDPEA